MLYNGFVLLFLSSFIVWITVGYCFQCVYW